ncbi:flagellar hook capping FlgD N-terminal domain-containing protein [Mesobacterium sp. TK19101]|uniref:Basal-body rod modification protein FlgD n=1 Tax=Mesobacterium hydrothermale TaxID=3111907 RepID=A0ABU6HGN8_9RHOB|nr:flagellar hook capping FlgD N-terminal domain-containing protein [Mesobacterium sp. TK19101]MEC3861619.1 flagellar hook capping FlgD N-terminal domain-containing protein [Mesobacterium sp. TK19101]
MTNAIETTTTATAANGQIQNPAKKTTTLTSDFETFLKMLTVQMTNQDPLNPADASEFSTQLATFSALEQQVLTNQLLHDLTSSLTAAPVSEAAALIGMQALSDAPARFAGTPLDLRADPPVSADRAVLIVRDADGSLVQSFDFDPDETELSWAGVDGDGRSLPYGTYQFEVESFVGADTLGTRPALNYATVTEVRRDGASTELVLDGGIAVNANAVQGIRLPQ